MSLFAREALFVDRWEAGCRLAESLLRFKDERPIVLAGDRAAIGRPLESVLDIL